MIIDELSLGLAPVVVNRLIPTIRSVAESGIGVLLIEQFATLALGLANRAYVMEGGRIRFSGMAKELRENPELLQSAYLLRAQRPATVRPARSATAGSEPRPSMKVACDRARARAQRRHRRHPRLLLRGASVCRWATRPPLEFPGYWLYAGATAPCVHIAERGPYARPRGRLGLAVPERDPGVGPVDHIAFSADDYDGLSSGSQARSQRSDATACPAGRARCSSRTRTACGSRSTSGTAERTK